MPPPSIVARSMPPPTASKPSRIRSMPKKMKATPSSTHPAALPRGPAFFDPVLQGRWGAARLAQLSGAPVVPIGIWGTEKVWPRSSRLPNVFNLADPPEVRIRVGRPVKLAGKSRRADTAKIMKAITKLLPEEARRPYTPTEEELAATYPPGYRGDPAAEGARRPGCD